MASLTALPNEIIDLIFEYLTTLDFIHLSETCICLHARALPFAFKHLTLTWHNSNERAKKSPNIQSLYRRFEANPELKNSVRRLTFKTSRCASRTEEDVDNFFVDLPGSEHPNFYFIIRDLIRQCNQLERLDLSIVFLIEDRRWLKTLMYGIRESLAENLKHVYLTRDDTTPDDWIPNIPIIQEECIMLLALPHVEVVDLDFFDHPELGELWKDDDIALAQETFWRWAPTKISKHLHTLHVSCAQATALAFRLIFREAPRLRVIDVNLFQHPVSYGFDMETFKVGLDYVKSTLTHIRIRYDISPDEEVCMRAVELDDVMLFNLGSFRDYATLTHLEISLNVLFGADNLLQGTFYPLSAVLPPNLETLVIRDDLYGFSPYQHHFEDGDAMDIFKRFLGGEWREATPNLKEFTYDLRNRGDWTVQYWDKEEKRDELSALCREQGIAGNVLWNW